MSKPIDQIEESDFKENKKIHTLSITEEVNMPWKQYIEYKGYNKQAVAPMEEMCTECIEEQTRKYGKVTINCKGLNQASTMIDNQLGEGAYELLESTSTPEELEGIKKLYSPEYWADNTIDTETTSSKRYYKSRWYQRRIITCSSPRKVLRMGRRCIEQNERVRGEGNKTYSIKHLYNLEKYEKDLPKILSFNQETLEYTYTNRYVILPNEEKATIKISYSNYTSNSVTHNHPIFVFRDKQWQPVEAADLRVGEEVFSVLGREEPLTITSLEEQHNSKTFHVSVLRSETFVTSNGVLHHNTGKSFGLTVGLLHKLVTHENYRVLMIAPMATMIDEIADTIETMCSKMENNPLLTNTQTPIRKMTFVDGGSFKGVTAGAQGAKGARGKGCELLFVDECLPATTKIRMTDGRYKQLGSLEVGEYIHSYNVDTKRFMPQRVVAMKCTGIQDIFKYKTVSGRSLTATANHPVLTREGWVPIRDAKDLAVASTKNSSIFYETVTECIYKGKERVYNFEVANTHTYIANDIITHNCDFLKTKDLDGILAILADNVNTELWVSSTPIGETNLYKLSKNPQFKEFHYPTYVSPNYSDTLDSDFRSQYEPTEFNQEFLALFGSDDLGVFQLQFITASTLPEDRTIDVGDVLKNRGDYDVIIGIDWNHDKVGTRVLVVVRSKTSRQYFIAKKDKVAQEGWTQMLAIQKVIDLNRVYNADYIYADEGFGISQITALRQFGLQQIGKVARNHPDLKLIDVVSVNFKSTIVVEDPVSREETKKQTKQYMVEHTADLLSKERILLQEAEDNDIILQLKNYVVKKRSATGLKVFGYREKQIGDHDLDALMIALLGFKQKYEEEGAFISFLNLPIINSREALGYMGMEGVSNPVSKGSFPVSIGNNVILNKRGTAFGRRGFKKRRGW